MGVSENERKNFFVSYTGKDENWALWIAETLENAGYTTVIQAWDFKSGGSFVNDMHEALKKCEKIIPVLSKAYLESAYCKSEWQNAFADDPVGEKRLLIPVRIEDVKPEGLLKARTYIDLSGLDDNAAAAERLLQGIGPGPAERKSKGFPNNKTRFPGSLPPNNLPDRNAYFTGREKELNSIAESFADGNFVTLTQTIYGLGGIGKTQIAKEYAYRYSQRYECVWWFTAETSESLYNGALEFAVKFCGLPPDAATPDNVRNSIREWAENNQKWLFVYDNAEEYGLLRGYLPRNHVGQGNTLITSRNEFWSDLGIVPQKIGLFTEEEAVAFLRRRTLGKPRDGAGPLAKELGYLPLALEHAGAYIAENDLSFSDYQKLYREYSFRLLRESETSERTAVDVTWQISIDKIKSESARQFLYLCSYYAPDKILVDSLIKNNVRLPEPLKKDAADPLALNRAVHELRRYSLINVSEADKNEIGVHRLLQEAIKSGLAPGNEYVRSCAENLTELIYDKYYSTAEARERFGALAPHGVSVCENLRRQGAVAEDFHRLFFNLAYGFNETAKYPDAVFFYNIALEIREKVLGKDHPDTATTYNNMAMVYKVQGDYGRALEFYGKALTISEKVLGKDHPDTATTYNNMAVVYEAQGYYDKALKFHGKVLEIREKVLEEDHPDTATTYNNMAVVYENKGDYDRALEFYGKAFAIYEKVLGKDHPDTATTYNNMAGIYYAQGDYGRALEFFGKALAIREKVLGKDHPYTATTYNDMALVYEAQGDYGRALEFFGKAFAIYEKVLGKDHPDTATTYNNMAVVYKAQGYYDRALEFYGKALAIREKVLGKDHRDTATTYNNMALVYYAQGDYDRVLEFYGKALEIREKVLGKDHPDNARTYNNMAGVFYAQGEYDSALEFYGKALAILKKKLGDHHPNTISASNNMLICEQSAKNRLIGS